ncbi:hypothetical protein FH972_008365 [Carpinus fangiana]|uniref:Uncharacterized protein n=1 Tax=Carpinus fangiana TaxID=176857 RepID=A0A5N6R194_9ROSI|nr:hypothetical protein FH972_008365 [Carpinus fangiana]
MSDDTPTTCAVGIDTPEPTHSTSAPSDSPSKTQSAIQSLSSILPSTPPPSLSSTTPKSPPKSPRSTATPTPAPAKTTSVTGSTPPSNPATRTSSSSPSASSPSSPASSYLSCVTLRKPLAGFEAVLLALYAHETTLRSGQPITVSVPDLSHPSVYHESKENLVCLSFFKKT